MNVVLDTNVYISALVFPGGVCDQVIRVMRMGSVKCFVSPDILTEFRRVLIEKFKFTEEEATDACDRIIAIAQLIYPRFRVQKIKSPDADNRILECAVEADAKLLVSGDKKHLIPLKSFQGVTIISPAEFLDFLDRAEF